METPLSPSIAPLGKGFLTGRIKSLSDISHPMLRTFPRFLPENFDNNLKLVTEIEKLAAKKGCTSGQIAINWVRALSDKPGMPKIIPIPGSTSAERVKENSKIIELTGEDLAEIDAILASFKPIGDRYPAQLQRFVDV